MSKTGLILVAFAVLGFSAFASWYGMSRDGEIVVTAQERPSVTPPLPAADAAQASVPANAPRTAVAESDTKGPTAPEASSVEEDAAIDPAIAARYDSNNADYPTLTMRLAEMRARRGGQDFEPGAVVAAVGKDTAWEVDDSIADDLPLTAEDRTDGREFIRFDPLKVESLVAGDQMEVQIAQASASYQMTVDRVQANEDGTVTWHGHLTDFNADNQVTFTRADTLTYGGIHTPQGHFVIEARDDKGWIVSGATLFKGHQDPIVPPESAMSES